MTDADGEIPWRWIVGVWSIPIALSVLATLANARESGHPTTFTRALWLGSSAWVLWIPFTRVTVWLGQRWPLDRQRLWRLAAGHLVAAAAIGVVSTAVTAIAIDNGESGHALVDRVASRVALRAPMDAILYFIILGVSYLVINTRRLSARELAAERMAKDLTEAQLSALRMQLQPHFLFNSLNAVTALVRDHATDRADRALVVLSDVLRTSLRHGTQARVPLKDEVAFIRSYLEIELLRFGDRLAVIYAISDDVADALVPTFVLQPLVENALRHGLLDLPDGGVLEIAAERRGESVVLSVVDDGVGLSPEWEVRAGQGVGITNARARLAHTYGSSGQLTIAARTDRSGTRASVQLPFEAGT